MSPAPRSGHCVRWLLTASSVTPEGQRANPVRNTRGLPACSVTREGRAYMYLFRPATRRPRKLAPDAAKPHARWPEYHLRLFGDLISAPENALLRRRDEWATSGQATFPAAARPQQGKFAMDLSGNFRFRRVEQPLLW